MFVFKREMYILFYSPQTLLAGMNKFLSQLEITFRRDPNNYRPRINKHNSIKVRMWSRCTVKPILQKLLFVPSL